MRLNRAAPTRRLLLAVFLAAPLLLLAKEVDLACLDLPMLLLHV